LSIFHIKKNWGLSPILFILVIMEGEKIRRIAVKNYPLESIRKDVIGNNILFETPFGKRHLLYADYTASGRGLSSIEKHILNIQKSYANTHTEDDYSGKYLTSLLYQAEAKIKVMVNAGEHGKIIAAGAGTTGALKKLQEILGIYMPPVTKDRIYRTIASSEERGGSTLEAIEKNKPVVFIGPYEHHTNELMWREAFVEVVKIGIDGHGRIDLKDLNGKLSLPEYEDRLKMGSFSAGSNITGIRTRVYEIARLCHRHKTFVFFDFAAVAPYIEIDMNRDDKAYFDAIFFSPHKFLGGPGSSGILIFNEKIYRKDLPPTTAGGGTVSYVGFRVHDFSNDIETREKAGTPPILQTIRAALAMELKEKIGIRTIEDIEFRHLKRMISALKKIKNLTTIGSDSSDNRVPIVSFNILHNGKILHPKFVTKLMNDLFGIQSRGGCSCAGPYGHLLLGIDEVHSIKFRNLILKGYEGIKPGWVRINLHYTLTEEDVDFIIKAIQFIARSGHLFLKIYAFNLKTGEWRHLQATEHDVVFSIDTDFSPQTVKLSKLALHRSFYFKKAERVAAALGKKKTPVFTQDEDEVEDIKFFDYAHKAV
jgi:selenocysteine lyase/cysteine desulfurase